MSLESGRIAFLIARDGEPAARAWCLDACRTYRKVVLLRRTHTLYRRGLIARYLELKRFALGAVRRALSSDPEAK